MASPKPVADAEPTVILFETAPGGSLDALLQHDGRTVYLYLNDRSGDFGTRACWVGNLAEAPLELSREDLKAGVPPILPRFFVNHPNGRPIPSAGELRLVWFEEGNGIALFEGASLLAVIPPWSGEEGFHGYARDCLAENEVCWPLPDRPALRERIQRAEEFWQQSRDGQPIAELRQQLIPEYRRRFGSEGQVYEIGKGNWPPRFIYRFDATRGTVLVSMGMSIRPQPNVELDHEAPSSVRRIELGMCLPVESPEESVIRHVEILASQVGFPWRRWTWLRHGQVIEWNQGGESAGHWLFVAEPGDGRSVGRFRSDPIQLLWAVRLEANEVQKALSGLDAFVDACRASHRLPG